MVVPMRKVMATPRGGCDMCFPCLLNLFFFFFFFKRSFAGKLTIEIAGYFLLALRWSVVVTPQMLHEAQKVSQHFYRPFPRPLDRVCLL